MRAFSASRYRWGSLFLLSGLAVLHAQNPVTVTPNPVFLNATVNGAPVQTLVTVNSTTGSAGLAFAAPSVPWLTIAALSFNTPATIPFTGNPAGMAAGVYNTSLALTTPSGIVTVPVIMTVNSPAPALTLSPGSLVFNYTQGGTLPGAQPLSIGSNAAVSYAVAGSANWITLSTTAGQASPGQPGAVTIGVDPTALAGPGTYVGSVIVTPAGGTPVLAPVVFNFTAGAQLISSAASLAFNVETASSSNVVQKTVTITSSGPPIRFGAVGSTLTTSGGIQWLTVSPLVSTTPATLTITSTGASLPPGQYQGSVNLAASDASGASLKIPVTLTVSSQALLDVSPTSLSFSYQVGGATPAHQFVTPSTSTAGQFYSIAVSTNGTGNWLQVAASGVTSAPVDVGMDPTGLATGTYTGTITFNSPNLANTPQTVTVTLAVTNNPTLTSPSTASGLTFNFEIGQGQPAAQTVSVNSSSGGPLGFSIAATQNNTSNNVTWLLASSPSSNVTPAAFNVSVNPNGMAAGRYTGALVVTTPGANPLSIPVTLNISNFGSPLLSVNPQSLTFTSGVGGGVNPQNITVTSTGESVTYFLNGSVVSPAGGSWLVLSGAGGPASAAASSVFFASAQTAGLPVGTYMANITVQPANGNPAIVIPVTLNITSSNVTLSPTTLAFTQSFGGPAPAQQTVNVASSSALPFTVTASGGNWLSVTPPNGTTPATLGISVNGAGLAPGNYTGQIVVAAAGATNGAQSVTVNLTVTSSQSLTVSANSLTFTSAAPQSITLTASGGSIPFTVATNVSSPTGGNWLSVSPSSGTATASPTSITISVNAQGLGPGTYSGSVTVSSPNAPSQTINVTLLVSNIPTPVLGTIVNGASFQPGVVAPGEIITINGTNLGPAAGVSTQAPPGSTLPTLFQGTQVTFDGIPAPLLYVSATQINAVVPYTIGGRSQTRLTVFSNNVSSQSVALNVTDSAPAIFPITAPGFPSTQGAILNENGSINSPGNPAPRGSVIVIYATGEGLTNPQGVDGLIVPADPNALRHPVLPVQVTVGGYPADLQYAGSAPGFVSGALQVNAVVPDATGSGTVSIVIKIGNNSSPAVTTVNVQ